MYDGKPPDIFRLLFTFLAFLIGTAIIFVFLLLITYFLTTYPSEAIELHEALTR